MNPSTSENGSQIQKKSNFDGSIEYISAASHYALKVAFQAVKEKCDKLQQKIDKFEEEKVELQHNGIKNLNINLSNKNKEASEKRITNLLSHHIFMIMAENKNLWDDLSKLKEENKLLENQNHKLEAKLKELHFLEDKSNLNNSNKFEIYGVEDVISLDVLNCDDLAKCNNEKNEQVSFSSIETVKDSSENIDQHELIVGINNELKEILNKWNEDKKLLQEQREGLKKALDSMKKNFQGMKRFKKFRETNTETITEKESLDNKFVQTDYLLIPSIKNLNGSTRTTEMLCPFCCKVLLNILEEEVDEHYLFHIQQCSVQEMSSLKSFEVI